MKSFMVSLLVSTLLFSGVVLPVDTIQADSGTVIQSDPGGGRPPDRQLG